MQVAQRSEAACAGAAEQLGVQAVGLARRVLAVAGRERLELLGVGVALGGELRAQVADVDLVAVRGGDLPKGVGEVDLRAVQQPEVVREVHGQALLTRTAATLKMGCLEAGSQLVSVSSFAARAVPSGPAASWSQ